MAVNKNLVQNIINNLKTNIALVENDEKLKDLKNFGKAVLEFLEKQP